MLHVGGLPSTAFTIGVTSHRKQAQPSSTKYVVAAMQAFPAAVSMPEPTRIEQPDCSISVCTLSLLQVPYCHVHVEPGLARVA